MDKKMATKKSKDKDSLVKNKLLEESNITINNNSKRSSDKKPGNVSCPINLLTT